MKTYALVEISGIRHMADDRGAAEHVRAEAEARGVKLILMRPMEHIDDPERFEAIADAIRAGGGGPGNQDQWSLIMSSLDNLKAAVSKNTTVVESALTLLAGLSERLSSAKDDPAAVEAIVADINRDADKLAAAVAANTPAEAPPGDPTTDTPPA